MALLQRTRILPQQRIDLPDYNNIEDFICADFKAIHKNVWTNENFVFSGFEATGTGTTDLVISLAGSSVVVGKDDGTLFIGASSLADLTTDALTPASTNYVEILIEQDTGGADSRAFWDQTAAAGAGGEFSQIVDTFIFTKSTLAINTSNFTGDADKVTLCEVDVNASGVITAIRDSRNLFWRLGRATDVNFEYNWASRTEPVNTQFSGADKDISNLKEFIDATMSRIKEIAGTTYWYEDSGVSLTAGFRNSALSAVTALGNNVTWTWSGTELSLTDDNGSPADADQLAAIRLFDSPSNILLTRMDGTGSSTTIPLADGEVVWIELPEPLADVDIDDIGLTSTNYRVSARGSVPNDDKTYWLAFREGSNLYIRNQGELEPGESAEISDNINENILQAIGIATETSLPLYTSITTVTQNSSLVAAVSALDAAAGGVDIALNQDRSLKVIEGGTWSLNLAGDELTLSSAAFIDLPEVTRVSNEIAAQTITLPNANSVAYVEINRASGAATLTVNVADVDALTPTQNTVIIARRVTAGVLVGAHSFLLKAGERLELDGALAEINRYFGQLRIIEHPINKDRVQITGVDITKLDGSLLGQSLSNLLLKFDGAEVDFETGQIFESDGTTPLGIDFTPATVAANQFQWYSITVLPSAANANGTINGQLLVLAGATTGATADAAARAPFANGIQLGQVVVQRNAGDTAFEDVQQADIVQLGIGSGSGSGGGSGSVLTADTKRRLSLSPYCYATANEIQLDSDTKINTGTSTATFSFADNALQFENIGDLVLSQELLDVDFLNKGKDVTKAEVMFRWKTDDPLATYELSRDGGNEFQAVTMNKIGETDTYIGTHDFADEATFATNINNGATDGTVTLTDDAGTDPDISAVFTVAATTTLKQLPLNITKNNSAAGSYRIKIVNDDTGSPSTDISDLLFESAEKNIDDLAAGANAVNLDFTLTLTAGTYHVVLETDQEYKDAYTVSTGNNITVESTGANLTTSLNGRALSLLLRVTSGTADVLSEGYAVFYDNITGTTDISLESNVEKFFFSSDENRTDFTLSFLPNPDVLEVYDPFRGQVYVAAEGVFRIESNTIKFAADTFATGTEGQEDILLVFRQVKGNGFDNSDQNANKIATIESNLIDIGEQLESVSDSMVLPKIAAPFTEVQNRALVPDFTQDLLPRMGGDRMMLQEVHRIKEEAGPNDQQVWGVPNDQFDQVRFVGNIDYQNSTLGTYIRIGTDVSDFDSFMEFTFFGTGVDLLYLPVATSGVEVSVDGVVTQSLNFDTNQFIASNRRHGVNVIINAAKGLPQGIHTIKLRKNTTNSGHLQGIQVLNETTDILVPQGSQLFKGKRLTHTSAMTTPYNSDFESGVLGTRGGHVLFYQKADGSVVKAVTPTDSTALFLSAADHSNEEIVRSAEYREFGYGLSGDVSVVNTSVVDAASTQDDGTTTLNANNVDQPSAFNILRIPQVGSFFSFTFVGTGLDIVRPNISTSPISISTTVEVDGVNVGNLNGEPRTGGAVKICSGLPYGTHNVKITTQASGQVFHAQDFVVYAPKMPSVPNGAKALANYYVMADYDSSNVTGTAILDGVQIPQGVIFKSNTREFQYSGANWSIGSVISSDHPLSGFAVTTLTNNNQPLSLEFFGTGAMIYLLGHTGLTYDFAVEVNDVLDATGVALTNATNLGGGSYRSSGTVGNNPCRIEFTGLPLGHHKISVERTAGSGNFSFAGAHIITPIHVPKNNGPKVIQKVLMVGGQGIGDLRKFSDKDIVKGSDVSHSSGLNSMSTTSGSSVPMAQLQANIYAEKDGLYEVNLDCEAHGNGSGFGVINMFVDGEVIPNANGKVTSSTAGAGVVIRRFVRLTKGHHHMFIVARASSGAVTIPSDANWHSHVSITRVGD